MFLTRVKYRVLAVYLLIMLILTSPIRGLLWVVDHFDQFQFMQTTANIMRCPFGMAVATPTDREEYVELFHALWTGEDL